MTTTTKATTPTKTNNSTTVKKLRKKRHGVGPVKGGMGAGFTNYDYNDYYGQYQGDYSYDYYDWICSEKKCQLCDILTSECCDPDRDVNCFLPDSCLNNPCLAGGTCIIAATLDGHPDFVCVCMPGLTGKYCQHADDYFAGAQFLNPPVVPIPLPGGGFSGMNAQAGLPMAGLPTAGVAGPALAGGLLGQNMNGGAMRAAAAMGGIGQGSLNPMIHAGGNGGGEHGAGGGGFHGANSMLMNGLTGKASVAGTAGGHGKGGHEAMESTVDLAANRVEIGLRRGGRPQPQFQPETANEANDGMFKPSDDKAKKVKTIGAKAIKCENESQVWNQAKKTCVDFYLKSERKQMLLSANEKSFLTNEETSANSTTTITSPTTKKITQTVKP